MIKFPDLEFGRPWYDRNHKLHWLPTVCLQRYRWVMAILQYEKWADQMLKVIDFGCSNLELSSNLRFVESVQHIIGIDIDENVLKSSLARVKYSIDSSDIINRVKPIRYDIYKGNITTPNECLLNADAIVIVEVIEHLTSIEFLNFDYNLFAFAQPKIMIFTTPNVEINILFNLKSRFRHYDHKFEWTREQFENWARNICLRYPKYVVEFFGIGRGPESVDHLGCCTQMALFMRIDFLKSIGIDPNNFKNKQNDSMMISTTVDYNKIDIPDVQSCHNNECHVNDLTTAVEDYKLIFTEQWPYYIETRTKEEIYQTKIREMFLNRLDPNVYPLDEIRYVYSIPFKDFPAYSDVFQDIQLLRSLIANNKRCNITGNDIVEITESSPEVSSDDDDDDDEGDDDEDDEKDM